MEEAKPTSFWIFDEHRRVYARDANGRATDLIWREHWVERQVTGETSRSWIIGGGWSERKIPKRGPWPMRRVCRSAEEVEARAWAEGAKVEIYRRASNVYSADLPEVVRCANALGIQVPLGVRHFAKEMDR